MKLTPILFSTMAGLRTVQAISSVTVTKVTTKDFIVPLALDQQFTTSITHLDARGEFEDESIEDDPINTRLTSYYITSPYTTLVVSTIGADGPNIQTQDIPDKTTVVRVTSFLNVTPTVSAKPPPPPEPEPMQPRRGCPSHICDVMPYPDHLCLDEKWQRRHPLIIENIATAGSPQC
ncbi:hypothetical protein E4T39_06571 [Aureobasidium subglaciale]|nr:hypothetical protein E4T39_06571 [Aureobasidium subglaciale]